MRRRRLLAASATTLALAAVPALASGRARVVGGCVHSRVRPASVILFCADANGALTHLRWTSFGGATARATGDYTINDCTPSCVAGHVHSYPVRVVFSRPRACPDGHRDYREETSTFSSSHRPKGAAGGPGQPGRMTLSCPLKT
ncbi:MAG: hypothetical protein ACRDLP_09250 [Solirubrobacteraceae bacterium]